MCSIQLSEGFAIYVVMWQQRMFCKILYTSPKKCWTGKIVPFLPCLHKTTQVLSSFSFHTPEAAELSPSTSTRRLHTVQTGFGVYFWSASFSQLNFGLSSLSVSACTVCANLNSEHGLQSVLVYMYHLLFCWMIHEVNFFLWLLLFS